MNNTIFLVLCTILIILVFINYMIVILAFFGGEYTTKKDFLLDLIPLRNVVLDTWKQFKSLK